MNKIFKNRGFVALPILIGGAVIAAGLVGGLIYKYENNQSVLSVVNKDKMLAQVSGVNSTITVLSPNGGENLKKGTDINIMWSDLGLSSSDSLHIYLYKGNTSIEGKDAIGSVYYSGSSPVLDQMASPANGKDSITWTIPTSLPDGSDYRIGIVGTGVFDQSDAPFTITAPQPICTSLTSCSSQYCQYGGNLKNCTVTNTDCSTSSYTTRSCSSAPTCTSSTSCVPQYCQYGGDLKKCTVKSTDCSTASYTTGGCNSAPLTSTVCDSTAKAIVDSVGGCTKIDKSLYSNIYNVCCVSVVVTKDTLLTMLNNALADGIISGTEKTDLIVALNSYLK